MGTKKPSQDNVRTLTLLKTLKDSRLIRFLVKKQMKKARKGKSYGLQLDWKIYWKHFYNTEWLEEKPNEKNRRKKSKYQKGKESCWGKRRKVQRKERPNNQKEKMMLAQINYIIEIEIMKKTRKNKKMNQDRKLRL